MNVSVEENKKFCEFGSREWANSLLRLGIAVCNNVDRVEGSRLQELFYIMRVLSEYGFEWQARRLRNQYHLALSRGRFTARVARADSRKSEEASI